MIYRETKIHKKTNQVRIRKHIFEILNAVFCYSLFTICDQFFRCRVHVESKITTQSVAEHLKYNSRPNAFSFLRQQTQRNKSLKIGWISGCGKRVTMIINQRYFIQINFHNDLLAKYNVTSRIILIYSYTTPVDFRITPSTCTNFPSSTFTI